METQHWDPKYEWKAVAMLALGFGLVGLDRFIINPLFPVMMKDLNLTYQDIGNISAALAMAWGISSLFMGPLSDRFGRRKVLIPSVIVFSLLAGFTGFATGVGGLILIRSLMGIAEGSYTPASIAATMEASKLSRRGLNLGIQQNAFPIFGLGLAPIIATQLVEILPSWRWAFALVSLPGFILAAVMYKLLRDTHAGAAPQRDRSPHQARHHWSAVFRYRNVVLAMLGMFCTLTCLFVVTAMIPSYLTDYLHLDIAKMGFVMSAIGFGGFTGQFILPALSDKLGRKPVVLMAYATTGVALFFLIRTGSEPPLLFALLFVIAFCNFSLTCLTVGPLASESLPPALVSTAAGFVVGAGEILGGGVAPALAGYIAQHYGIQYILWVACVGMAAGLVIALGLKETAPVKLKARMERGVSR